MRHRYRLSADPKSLTARYTGQRLILHAKGICIAVTSDIGFKRLPSIPEIHAYELIGWLNNDVGVEQEFDHYQSFPCRVDPGPVVIIHDSGETHEVLVEYEDPRRKPVTTLVKAKTEQSGEVRPAVIPSIHERLFVVKDEEFDIKVPAAVSKGGFVELDSDPENLRLVKAGIKGGDLVWTLTAGQMGTTEAIVTIAGSEDPSKWPYYEIHYEIVVIWMPKPTDPKPASAEQITFLNRVGEGIKHIQQTYKDAELLAAVCRPILSDQPADDWRDLGILTITCSAKDLKTGKPGSVSATSWWGEPWSNPKFAPPLIGIGPFSLEGLIDADKAQEAMRNAGYEQPFNKMALTRTTLLPDGQPLYTFSLITGQVVRVSAKDGKVQ